MTDTKIQQIHRHLGRTLYYLLKCWDELRRIERMLDRDIDTDALYDLASEFGPPEDALTLTVEQAGEWCESLPRK